MGDHVGILFAMREYDWSCSYSEEREAWERGRNNVMNFDDNHPLAISIVSVINLESYIPEVKCAHQQHFEPHNSL